jgi:hypothetical protein
VGVHERTKKMVADPDPDCTFIIRIGSRFCGKQCSCTICVSNFLIMEDKEVYKTNGVLVLALLAIYTFILIYHEKQVNELLYGALGLLVIQMVFFKLAYYIAYGWMQFGKGLGFVNSKVLLSLVFLIVVVPIGFLKRKKADAKSTNWLPSSESKVDFKKMG